MADVVYLLFWSPEETKASNQSNHVTVGLMVLDTAKGVCFGRLVSKLRFQGVLGSDPHQC